MQYIVFLGTALLFGVMLVLPAAGGEAAARQGALIHHDLTVTLQPEEHRLSVKDTITLPENHSGALRFLLHSGLAPSSPTPGVRVVREAAPKGAVPLERFRVEAPPGTRAFVLAYGGSIHHPLESYGKEYARGFRDTPGIIDEEGVYLSGSSYWYPAFDEELITFKAAVELPGGWDAVSQGARTLHNKEKNATRVQWDSPEPQDSIYLIAAPFTEYSQQTGRVTAMAFLRTPDRELANKYIEATSRYITLYEKLIGPYPYRKFALVENFWETGFGMPSFTLLGPKIIRFPFIITSSYPHEILHTWWGNSVFPDYRSGNWSEGLTAYLADHLIKEQQGSGVEHRQTTLQKYTDYVLTERDLPLTEFRSRHSSSSEAVGYGKSLMVFHMLRRELGDKAFTAGLQELYRSYKFKAASFSDLGKSFEKSSGRDLKSFFDQWVTRRGAPQIALGKVQAKKEGSGYLLTFSVDQLQEGKAYRLNIPLAVTLEGQERAYQTTVTVSKKRSVLSLPVPARPVRLDLDPEFDLFRRLDLDEIPPALSQALGARKMLILLPASAKAPLLRGYRDFARMLAASGPDTAEIKLDTEIGKLPADRAVAVVGWENRFAAEALKTMERYGASAQGNGIRVEATDIPRGNHAVVLTARNAKNSSMALLFIAADTVKALPGLGRKLPHYHKYSYLGFEGDEPVNIAKGRWPVVDSPMTVFLPGRGGAVKRVERAALAAREPLAALPKVFSSERMMETVRFLSGDGLKGRGFGSEGLELAAAHIAERFREAGLMPGGETEESYFQTWSERGGEPEAAASLRNVVGILPGKRAEWAGQSIVIGAHYDHLGLGWPDVREDNKGKVHPGADDNASGVAVLLELARVLGSSTSPDRTVIFVAFSGEEAGRRGSKQYIARQQRFPAASSRAMINLDTVGRLGKRKLLVLGSDTAKEWLPIVRGAGFATGIEIETVAERLDASDQVSFEAAGIPAIQLFSGPHPDYHRPTDTADKIDAEGLVKAASAAKEVIEYLAARPEPLTPADRKRGSETAEAKGERRVSLGTIPDFTFSGAGCRLSGVVPGSAAEICGLKEGDIIIRINAAPVNSLKDLSNVLKSLSPGNRIGIIFLREGREHSVDAEVAPK